MCLPHEHHRATRISVRYFPIDIVGASAFNCPGLVCVFVSHLVIPSASRTSSPIPVGDRCVNDQFTIWDGLISGSDGHRLVAFGILVRFESSAEGK
jgi:hypothetical protein